MGKQYKIKIGVIIGIILFTVCTGYLLNRGSKRRQALSQQQQAHVSLATSSHAPSSPQHLLPTVLRVSHPASASAHLQSFEKTVSNLVVVQKVYNAMLALPQEHSNVKLCTFNPTVITNELSFFDGSKLIIHATVVVGGCGGWVRIDSNDHDLSADDSFFSLLSNSLGVARQELYGVYGNE